MTVESVDKALEEVRPFLIADGGNVEVADVSNGCVSLRLQVPCQMLRCRDKVVVLYACLQVSFPEDMQQNILR